MLYRKFNLKNLVLLGLLLMLAVLSACTMPSNTPVATEPGTPAVLPLPTNTTTPPVVSTIVLPSTEEGDHSVFLNLNGVAQGYSAQVIPATPSDSGGPYWENQPEHLVITLEGYPVTDHRKAAQIFIYPVEALAAINPSAGQVVTDLQAALQAQTLEGKLPFLPLINEVQAFTAQAQPLSFVNGAGMRYLTQTGQAAVLAANNQLFYTYQGITGDGKFYVAAVLPVSLIGLTADAEISGNVPDDFNANYPGYILGVIGSLNQKAPDAFAPDLSSLDALIGSIEVK